MNILVCGGLLFRGKGNSTDHKSKSIFDKVNSITTLEKMLNLLPAQYKRN